MFFQFLLSYPFPKMTKYVIKDDFKVYCGIDFGTQGFGLAYAYVNPKNKQV